MLQGILNTIEPILPAVKVASTAAVGALLGHKVVRTAYLAAAGAILGHKVVLAAGCKVVAIYAKNMGQSNVDEWNQASNEYMMQIKKDGVRDLTFAATIAGLGLSVGWVGEYFTEKPSSIYSYVEKIIKTISN